MPVRVWLICLVVASLWAPHARADAEKDARKAFEQGVAASSEARWQDAQRAFQHSLDLVVKPSTLFNLAVADLKLGRAQEALDALARFEQLANPKQHTGMLERVPSLRAEAERTRDAARPANERARGLIDPGNLQGDARESYIQGRDAYARGDDKLALDAFERAHQQSGKNELLFDIGIAADRLREDERAIDALSRFIDLFPELPEAEQARRHLDRLNRVIAEQQRPVPAATVSAAPAAESPHPATKVDAPVELGAPRAIVITGAVLAAGALGAAAWWIERSTGEPGRCLDHKELCTNYDQVHAEQRTAMAVTIPLAVASVAFLTAGGVWLHKRKQASVALRDFGVQASAFGAGVRARFAF